MNCDSIPAPVMVPKATYKPLSFQSKPLAVMIAGLISCSAQGAKASSVSTPSALKPEPESLTLATFDIDMMKSRGLDPKIAEFLKHAPRFMPGTHRVTLEVNGVVRGTAHLTFDADGHLCFNRALIDAANLKLPHERYRTTGDDKPRDEDCYDFVAAYPQTEIGLHPGREKVSLLLSSDALAPFREDFGSYEGGGVGAFLNYELLGQRSEFSSGQSDYYSAGTELGFNAGDWIVRSRQSLTAQNAKRTFQTLYTYAQKTFVEHKATLQAGEINIANSVFPGAAITGVQVVPDAALQGKRQGGATVEGIAQSQARVEVRQAGALLHTSLVPAGPFKLEHIQLLNGATDLDVRVIESNGEARSFTVAAASLIQTSQTASGFSLATGRVRRFNARNMQSPAVVTVSNGWLLNPRHKVFAGAMLSDQQYQALGLNLDSNLTQDSTLSLRTAVAKAGVEGVGGAKASAALTTQLAKNLSLGVNVSQQTPGYRDLLDTTRVQTEGYVDGITRNQYGVSLNWNDDVLGGFSLGYSNADTFQGSSSRHLTASWGKTFEHATLSLNLERTLGKSSHFDEALGRRRVNENGSAAYLTVSIPLGKGRNVRTYANKRNGVTRFGASFDDTSNDFAKYRLSAERNEQRRQQDFSGDLNLALRYAQANLGYSQNGPDRSSYRGQLRGAALAHSGGVTLSPHHLNDTFGVAKVGDVAGVKLNTPSGPVWTDYWGNAVVPQLNAYKDTRIEIDTKSLPRNVDLKNGYKSVSAARGSVQALDFPVITSRRVLLRVTDAMGHNVEKGSAVLDAQGHFVTTVVDDGKVFLTNGHLESALTIARGNDKSCAIHFALPKEADAAAYFETVKASCLANE
jgi:outer membrane usher protein FimD/PapC